MIWNTCIVWKVKVKQSHYRPGQALRVRGGSGSQISRQLAHEEGNVVSPTHRPPFPQETFLVLISVRGWVDFGAIVRPERLCQFTRAYQGLLLYTKWSSSIIGFCPFILTSFSKSFLSFRFTDQNFLGISVPSLTRYRLQLTHIPNFIALIIFDEYYSCCNLPLYFSHRCQININ